MVEEPQDLGVKIGTPEEAFWTGIKKKCKDTIKQCEHEITIQKHIVILADNLIMEEENKKKEEESEE